MGDAYSDRARSVWAKTPVGDAAKDSFSPLLGDGRWLPLYAHLEDAAAVAGWLWDYWLADHVKGRVAARVGGADRARQLVMFLAGVHDIGKATPIFSCADQRLLQLAASYRLDPFTFPAARSEHPHGALGGAILADWLTRHGMSAAAAQTWAVVVGSHHGVPPTDAEHLLQARDLRRRYGSPEFMGRAGWAEVREELLAAHWSANALLHGVEVELDQPTQVVLTGLVVTADWIASNTRYFPFDTVGEAGRFADGMGRAGLHRPWRPGPTPDTGQLFEERFRFGASPRWVQRAAVEAAKKMGPGLLIIEAAMGEGKTEAALMAAEVLAARFGLGGVHFALPTQASTNMIFDRMMRWIEQVPGESLTMGASVHLGHGKAALNDLYAGLPVEGVRHMCDDEPHGRGGFDVSVDQFFHDHRQTRLFAGFCITTVDQLLMMGLRRRHLMMNHLAEAGKVVIVDEVHAYDAWMSVYLDRVLEWLAAYGVPVILLSATLPPSRRQALVDAYCGPGTVVPATTAYPLVTSSAAGQLEVTTPPEGEAPQRTAQVALEFAGTDDAARIAVEAAQRGACVLLIRNTVNGAVADYATIRRSFDRASLHHSRFIAVDRANGDARLERMFGGPADNPDRPDGWVAVCTQVAEQSLDVDFDMIVTEVAPVDLVLQRIGRVHRHVRPRPAGFETPRCVVVGIGYTAGQAPELPRGSSRVYGAWNLLRTAAVLDGRTSIELPGDIPALVVDAYENDGFPAGWDEAAQAAREAADATQARKLAGARKFTVAPPKEHGAIFGWLNASGSDDESKAEAQVRDAEQTLETIVLVDDGHGRWRTPGWIGGANAGVPVPRDTLPGRDTCLAMLACTIRLSRSQADDFNLKALADELWGETPAVWREGRKPSLIGSYPVLILDGSGTHRGRAHYHYDAELGFRQIKEETQ